MTASQAPVSDAIQRVDVDEHVEIAAAPQGQDSDESLKYGRPGWGILLLTCGLAVGLLTLAAATPWLRQQASITALNHEFESPLAPGKSTMVAERVAETNAFSGANENEIEPAVPSSLNDLLLPDEPTMPARPSESVGRTLDKPETLDKPDTNSDAVDAYDLVTGSDAATGDGSPIVGIHQSSSISPVQDDLLFGASPNAAESKGGLINQARAKMFEGLGGDSSPSDSAMSVEGVESGKRVADSEMSKVLQSLEEQLGDSSHVAIPSITFGGEPDAAMEEANAVARSMFADAADVLHPEATSDSPANVDSIRGAEASPPPPNAIASTSSDVVASDSHKRRSMKVPLPSGPKVKQESIPLEPNDAANKNAKARNHGENAVASEPLITKKVEKPRLVQRSDSRDDANVVLEPGMALDQLVDDVFRSGDEPNRAFKHYEPRLGVLSNRPALRFDEESPWTDVASESLSAFSMAVSSASYMDVRDAIFDQDRLPETGEVRIEELVNYFDYDYQTLSEDSALTADMVVTKCPWNPDHKLARVAIQTRRQPASKVVANDVRFMLEFNPTKVLRYRLIGFENFQNAPSETKYQSTKITPASVSAGESVTAIYELSPVQETSALDQLKYQKSSVLTDAAKTGELLTIKLRYDRMIGSDDTDESQVPSPQTLEIPLMDSDTEFDDANPDTRFAVAVASFGMHLRNSQYSGQWTLKDVERITLNSLGDDPDGKRAEFLQLVRQAMDLMQTK